MNQENKSVFCLSLKDGEVVRLTLNLLENKDQTYTVKSNYGNNEIYESELFDTYDGGYCHLYELALDYALEHSNLKKHIEE
jgi:hypothetical protein